MFTRPVNRVSHTIGFGLLMIIVLGSLTTSASIAQQVKIGFVNSTKILEEFPEAQQAKRKLEAYGKRIQDTLETMSSAYQTRLQEYQQKSSLMTEPAKQTAQQELLAMEQRAIEFRERKLGREGEFSDYQDKVLGPIYDKVKKVIEEIARLERLTFVFDKTDNIQVLLYGDPKFDYTFTVIDRLKRK